MGYISIYVICVCTYQFIGFGPRELVALPINSKGLGPWDGRLAHEFVGFGTTDGHFANDFIGFGSKDCNYAYDFIGFGPMNCR